MSARNAECLSLNQTSATIAIIDGEWSLLLNPSWKGVEANMIACPPWMLNGSSFAAATGRTITTAKTIRFPQPVRVGDLIGMPLLDLNSKTLGYVQQVVQTTAGEIELPCDSRMSFGGGGGVTRTRKVSL